MMERWDGRTGGHRCITRATAQLWTRVVRTNACATDVSIKRSACRQAASGPRASGNTGDTVSCCPVCGETAAAARAGSGKAPRALKRTRDALVAHLERTDGCNGLLVNPNAHLYLTLAKRENCLTTTTCYPLLPAHRALRVLLAYLIISVHAEAMTPYCALSASRDISCADATDFAGRTVWMDVASWHVAIITTPRTGAASWRGRFYTQHTAAAHATLAPLARTRLLCSATHAYTQTAGASGKLFMAYSTAIERERREPASCNGYHLTYYCHLPPHAASHPQ